MPCRTIAVANQKGGTGKTATTLSLGVALARLGRRVLLVDADPQGDLTKSLGWKEPDALERTLADHLNAVIEGDAQTEGGRRLAGAALLVGYGDGLAWHGLPPHCGRVRVGRSEWLFQE